MSGNFFDKSILESSYEEEYESIKDYDKLTYYLKKTENLYSFHCEINGQRLNQGELKALIKLNENKKIMNESDAELLTYIIHKISPIQTIYKLSTDIEVIIKYLANCKFKFFLNDKESKVVSKNKKLDLNLYIGKDSNIKLDILNKGGFFWGNYEAFYVEDQTIMPISDELPLKLYKEIIDGNNKFSIETFFQIKNSIIPKLKKLHNLKISDEIEKLSSLSIEEKIAPYILEIGKSVHFITFHLKYKIGDELFNIEDYKYLETINWMNKPNLIKITKEDSGLIKYISDEKLSEHTIDTIFEGVRIKYSKNQKSPFSIMVPISSLETVVKKVLPKAHKTFQIEYKEGQKLTLSNSNVKFEIDTNLKKNLNLFEFKVRFKIGDEFFDIEFLKEIMSKNRKHVQLKDGRTVNIENFRDINKWIEFLNKFEFKRTEKTYKAQSSSALELNEFLKNIEGTKVTSNEDYKNMITEVKDRTPIEPIKIPKQVSNVLRDYQIDGVYWMYFLKKYGFGGILADEMGLGKTIQALTVLSMNNNNGTHLVVCPKSLIYNWENEIKKFLPDMKVLIIDKDQEKRKKLIKTANNYDIVITSYSILQRDYSYYDENKIIFNYQILDEAHYIKNIKTLSSKAVRVINAKRKVLLTGTPLENNLDELFGTFELIMPGYLGTKTEFRNNFVAKIERNNQIALDILQAKIRPFILRRTKNEVLKELPDKQEQIVYNEMTNKQIGVYNEILNRVKSEVNILIEKQGFEKSRIQVLSALLKLRQVCNHPSLVDKSFSGEVGISGKHEQFKELLSEVIASGEKVLVFSQFTSMLNIFEKDLNERDITFSRLDGSTKNRQEVVDEFNNNKSISVFLISLKAGGVGLNLTSASVVFLYDPWWNPMVEQQAVDRAHRIGQKKKVNIYKFITKNSIEEKILKLQERKGNLFENLVVEDSGFMKRLEWEDLMELFD